MQELGTTPRPLRRRLAGMACAIALVAAPLTAVTAAPAYALNCGFNRSVTWYGYFTATYYHCSGPASVRKKAALVAAPDNGPCVTVGAWSSRQIYSGWDYPSSAYNC